MQFRGRDIHPYESFYWDSSIQFFCGQIGGGVARCVKTDNSLATVVIDERTIVAMRGRDPNILTPKHTEYDKVIRKRYETHEIQINRHDITTAPRTDGISNTLTSVQKDKLLVEPKEMRYRIRKLTPRECFRLMGLDDADIDTIQGAKISDTQQYKMAGNSIVVDVLYHIFRSMFCENNNYPKQLTLF